MSEWIHSTVGAVTTYQRAGGTPTAGTDAFYGGEIPFVTIEDITNGTRFLDRTEKNLSELGLRNSAAWLIEEPHILYSMYATVGKPIINRIRCATNQAIIALKESPEIEQSFLFYQLLFIRPQVYKFTAQTTQSNLNAGSVKRLPIAYPKRKAEQRKIAAILTSIDTAIEKTEALIEKYQQIKAGLMHDLFTRGVLPNGQLRPPRDQAPEFYQETAIGWIPKDWDVVPVESCCSAIVDCPHSTPYYETSGIPCIRTADMVPGELLLEQAYRVNETAYRARVERLVPRAGDIIYSREGERLGIASPVGIEPVCLGQRVMLLRPEHSASQKYLMWAMNMPLFYRQVLKGLGATTSPHVNVGDIRRLLVPRPSLDEQLQIGLRITGASGKLRAETIVKEKLLRQKLGLMQDLLTGKVQVNTTYPESLA